MKRSMPALVMIGLSLWSGYVQAIAQVQAPSGLYTGTTEAPNLHQFLGIPYAEPPVGKLRFTNPVLFGSNASTTFNATTWGPGCSQLDQFALANGLSEDCLTLNVVKPNGSVKNLPVLFFIHGGGNLNGQSAYYNGTALVQHSMTIKQPVIYVSFNYRLGGFGFLNSPDAQAAGVSNLGLKDQYLALQWVNKNIKSFGGDPKKVTIFGESSGAANCWSQAHYAYVKKEANKYFRGMITQSGAPGSPGFPIALTPEDGASDYNKLLQETNCTRSDNTLDCLRDVPHSLLAPALINAPVLYYTIDQDWFTTNFTYLLETKQFADIPLIHGANLNEGSIFLPDPFNVPNRTALIETVSSFGIDNNTAARLIDTYFITDDEDLGKGVSADPTASHEFWVASAVYQDLFFDTGRRNLLKVASRKADTWGYMFKQQPPPGSLELDYEYPGLGPEFGKRVGVYHGAELPYVFGEVTSLAERTEGDVAVAIAMMNAWISFAYRLRPTRPDHLNAMTWPKYDSGRQNKLLVFEEQAGNKIRVEHDTARAAVYKIWGEALRAMGQNPPF